MMLRSYAKHQCGNPEWAYCTVCAGRLHHTGCTTVTSGRLNKQKDCCKARHEMLYAQGQTVGLDDSSVSMLEGFK